MWPTSVLEGVILLSYTIGLLISISTIVGKWLEGKLKIVEERNKDQLERIGERFDEAKEKLGEAKGSLESLKFDFQKVLYTHESHARELEELRLLIKSIGTSVEEQRRTSELEVRRIGELVAEIKTTVKLLIKKGVLD